MYVFNIFIIEHYVRFKLVQSTYKVFIVEINRRPGYNRCCKLTLW